MDISDSIELVLKLARKCIYDSFEMDETVEQHIERMKAQDACDTLEDFAVNHLGDD